MIQPGCCLASLLVDFAENYERIAQVRELTLLHMSLYLCRHIFNHCFIVQVLSQYVFFNATGTGILVVVLHSWNYATNKTEGVSHFMIN